MKRTEDFYKGAMSAVLMNIWQNVDLAIEIAREMYSKKTIEEICTIAERLSKTLDGEDRRYATIAVISLLKAFKEYELFEKPRDGIEVA